MHITIYWWYFR